MASTNANVDFNKFDPKYVTMNVKVNLTQEFKIRKWIALNLIRLATIILNCNLKVEDNTDA